MAAPVLVESLEAEVRSRPLPRHVAIIMDGNGRWAGKRGLPRVEGHREGAESVREVTRTARRLGVQALTLYAFSAENWGRPEHEVDALMGLLAEFLEAERAEMMENGVRLNAIGELERLPELVQPEARPGAGPDRAPTTGMILTLALSYGGRQELVAAARKAAAAHGSGARPPRTSRRRSGPPASPTRTSSSGPAASGASPTSSSGSAPTPSSTSPRRCGRTSAAGSCCLAIADFQGRQRRFGLTGAQLPEPR